MQKSMTEKSILVTGASGRLGRCVVEFLLDAGAKRIIAGTRTPEKLADLHARGAEIRRVDFDDATGLATALNGVDRVWMICTDAVIEPGRRMLQHKALIKAAVEARVEHLGYTSFARSEPDSPIELSKDHHGTEQAVRASGLAYTLLRNHLFTDSALNRTPAMLATGKLKGLAGGGGVAYVTREDCARAVAAVIGSEQPPTGMMELSGPETFNGDQLAALVSEITGKPIRYVCVEPEELVKDRMADGMTHSCATSRVSIEFAIASGYLEFTTNAVAELTGRQPTRLRDALISADIQNAVTRLRESDYRFD